MGVQRFGKGTKVYVQPITASGDPVPVVTNDFTTGWTNIGCTFGAKPPGCSWNSTTGEQCLDDTGVPTTELEDSQEDNPSFIPAFDPQDAEYILLEDWCSGGDCLAFKMEFPGGGLRLFLGRIKEMIPDDVARNTYMRTPITLIRTSMIYRTEALMNTGIQNAAIVDTCREP